MIKSIIGILFGVISIFPPQYFMWYKGFERHTDELVLTLSFSAICAIIGLVLSISGIKELHTWKRIIAIVAVVVCAISLLSFMYVLQNWFLAGGLID
jgi:hypothetical protein